MASIHSHRKSFQGKLPEFTHSFCKNVFPETLIESITFLLWNIPLWIKQFWPVWILSLLISSDWALYSEHDIKWLMWRSAETTSCTSRVLRRKLTSKVLVLLWGQKNSCKALCSTIVLHSNLVRRLSIFTRSLRRFTKQLPASFMISDANEKGDKK